MVVSRSREIMRKALYLKAGELVFPLKDSEDLGITRGKDYRLLEDAVAYEVQFRFVNGKTGLRVMSGLNGGGRKDPKVTLGVYYKMINDSGEEVLAPYGLFRAP